MRFSLVVTVALAAAAHAQSFQDLMLVRNRPSPYGSVLKFRAGMLGGMAQDNDPDVGLEDKYTLDGFGYFHGEGVGDRQNVIDAYAGRDGLYFGAKDNLLLGRGNQSRLELFGRLWPFYREGFYREDDFVPTGSYEARDFGGALGIGRELDQDLRIEFGGFYRRYQFDANERTASSYIVPEDYNTYGARVILEHNTLQLGRATGRPESGFIFTVLGEREQNDAGGVFGVSGVYESRLPKGLWRLRGHLEWYFPQSDSGVWEIVVDGNWSDEQDRIYNADAQKPVGNIWGDGELRYRLDFSESLSFAPFVKLQFVRNLDENGVSSNNKFFYGGGANLNWDLGSSFTFLANYSYLTNPSREPVSISEDTYGEHRFFVGLEVRFGATGR